MDGLISAADVPLGTMDKKTNRPRSQEIIFPADLKETFVKPLTGNIQLTTGPSLRPWKAVMFSPLSVCLSAELKATEEMYSKVGGRMKH